MTDSDSLVLHWTEANDYDEVPKSNHWEYVIGVDVGFEDADAIAVIGWRKEAPNAYLVAEHIASHQGITELALRIESLIKRYNPMSVVMDTGGLGKKIAEELRKRYALPIKAAEKTRKFEYLELLDDALRQRSFFAKKSSRFKDDSFLLEWDKDKSNGDRRVVSDAYHSDIIDAVLYGFREAMQWTYKEPAIPAPKYGTNEWFRQEIEEMERAALAPLTKDESDPANWTISDWE